MLCQCVTEFRQKLQCEERPDLRPVGREIILRVTAAGVCHSDLHIRDGGYDMGRGKFLSFKERGMALPHVPGHEPVGRIIACGPEAPSGLDRDIDYLVYPWQGCGTCDECVHGLENFCLAPRFLGMITDGAYATQVRIPDARYLFPIGDLAPEHAAPLACSGLTAYGALKKVQDSLARFPAVIIGAGGLGLMAIGLVAAMGGRAPVAVDIDPVKREAAAAAGARAAIDANAPDAVAQIVAAVGAQPAAVIDFVGAEATAQLGFDAIRKGGSLVMVGLFGGAAPWSLPAIPVKSARILGSYLGSLGEFDELMTLVRANKVPVLPTTCFALQDVNLALDELARGKIVGRAVLTPNRFENHTN
jgi:propanol-preferring alcohol dehydrogenase